MRQHPDVPKKKFGVSWGYSGLRRYVSVCLSCRKTFKGSSGRCCKNPQRYNVSGSFKSPGKHDERLWKKLELILKNGLFPSRANLTASFDELNRLVKEQQDDTERKQRDELDLEKRKKTWKNIIEHVEGPCVHCGMPKVDGHTGRRSGYKCIFDATHYEGKPVEPDLLSE